MAQIIGGIGTSHSPMLLNDPQLWADRADQDRSSPDLFDSAGVHRSYDELERAAGDRYVTELEAGVWERRYTACHAAMDRLAADVQGIDCDVVVIVGDDQEEVFEKSIQPAVGIYWGKDWHTGLLEHVPPGRFFENVKAGWAMDAVHIFEGAPELGYDLVRTAVDLDFDVTSLAEMPKGRGFGHAYGFVIRRLLGNRNIPVLPVLLNTYYPPNQPSAARCYDLGRALAEGVRRSGSDSRVVFAASGGLSHFVVHEELDRQVLDAIVAGDADTLRSIPASALQSGASEIRNWITIAGAMEGRGVAWHEYVPCYRSQAGTGCGMAFLRWN
jgi:3-O-methylgallate 3,4-dioxygenase